MDKKVEEKVDDARQGETSGHMRWVLGVSLGLAILVVAIVWLWSAYH